MFLYPSPDADGNVRSRDNCFQKRTVFRMCKSCSLLSYNRVTTDVNPSLAENLHLRITDFSGLETRKVNAAAFKYRCRNIPQNDPSRSSVRRFSAPFAKTDADS